MGTTKDVNNRLDKLNEINTEQSIKLAILEAKSIEMNKLIEHLVDNHDELVKISAVNSESLQHHIKRTDALQNRQSKVLILLVLLLGMGITQFGPKILSLLGLLL